MQNLGCEQGTYMWPRAGFRDVAVCHRFISAIQGEISLQTRDGMLGAEQFSRRLSDTSNASINMLKPGEKKSRSKLIVLF